MERVQENTKCDAKSRYENLEETNFLGELSVIG